MYYASPKKLVDGEWGATFEAEPTAPERLEGVEIEITTRAGKSWRAIVDEVISHSRRTHMVVCTTRKCAVEPAPEPAGFSPVKMGDVWGVVHPSTEPAVESGAVVTVTTRAGKSWTAVIDRAVGTDRGGARRLYTVREDSRPKPAPRKSRQPRSRLVGYHTSAHCSCGNWSGVGSPCLYSYGEAKEAGDAYDIEWRRETASF